MLGKRPLYQHSLNYPPSFLFRYLERLLRSLVHLLLQKHEVTRHYVGDVRDICCIIQPEVGRHQVLSTVAQPIREGSAAYIGPRCGVGGYRGMLAHTGTTLRQHNCDIAGDYLLFCIQVLKMLKIVYSPDRNSRGA